MKSYIEFMNELNSDEIYKALVAYGLFSDKLPPFLSSESFFNYCKNKSDNFNSVPRQYVYYENMRNINIPRQLGIPNPMAYERLCKCIAENWDQIKEHFYNMTKNQEYKVSRIHVRKMYNKSPIFEMNYSNWRVDGTPEPCLLIGKKYIVHADIANCFPNMYTHALTWALAGKATAKKIRSGKWYNDLDIFTQNTKDGETHGLLIGPHAYNILSEIILCVIDYHMVEKGWEYVRHIDDYTCYVENEESAQRFLIDLQTELREFDLSLNHKKTVINPLPMAAVEQWVRKINSLSIITNYGQVDFKNCRSYLDYALEIAKTENGNSSVLKYAIKVLSGLDLTKNAKKYEAKTVFYLCLIFPYLIPLLDKYIFQKCNVSFEEIADISTQIYNLGIESHNPEMASYAIYFSIKYNFTIDDISSDKAIFLQDCILLLLTYKYFEKNNNTANCKKLKDYAKILSNDDIDFNKNWIFVYEVLTSGLLRDEWKPMKKAGVTFINI